MIQTLITELLNITVPLLKMNIKKISSINFDQSNNFEVMQNKKSMYKIGTRIEIRKTLFYVILNLL